MIIYIYYDEGLCSSLCVGVSTILFRQLIVLSNGTKIIWNTVEAANAGNVYTMEGHVRENTYINWWCDRQRKLSSIDINKWFLWQVICRILCHFWNVNVWTTANERFLKTNEIECIVKIISAQYWKSCFVPIIMNKCNRMIFGKLCWILFQNYFIPVALYP